MVSFATLSEPIGGNDPERDVVGDLRTRLKLSDTRVPAADQAKVEGSDPESRDRALDDWVPPRQERGQRERPGNRQPEVDGYGSGQQPYTMSFAREKDRTRRFGCLERVTSGQ
jgi:hypothetical protein